MAYGNRRFNLAFAKALEQKSSEMDFKLWATHHSDPPGKCVDKFTYIKKSSLESGQCPEAKSITLSGTSPSPELNQQQIISVMVT